jgi:hypothetical protein
MFHLDELSDLEVYFYHLRTYNRPLNHLRSNMKGIYIVAYRPLARQLPWNKQIHDSRYRVTSSQTDMFPRQQLK